MKKDHFIRWRANFFTGLAIVLPAIISVGVIFWLFFTVSSITDTLLIFIPKKITHAGGGNGPGSGQMYWYWSVVALLLAIILTMVVGLLARNYLGKKLIEWVDSSLLRVPLLNKVYGATKQVNEAFTSGSKTSFKTVVMIEFPRAGNVFDRFSHERSASRRSCKNRGKRSSAYSFQRHLILPPVFSSLCRTNK